MIVVFIELSSYIRICLILAINHHSAVPRIAPGARYDGVYRVAQRGAGNHSSGIGPEQAAAPVADPENLESK